MQILFIFHFSIHLLIYFFGLTSICYLQVEIRGNTDELFQKKLSHSKYQWMRDRITRLWPDWKRAATALENDSPTVRNRQRKNVS